LLDLKTRRHCDLIDFKKTISFYIATDRCISFATA
jgi:hypothetical protein